MKVHTLFGQYIRKIIPQNTQLLRIPHTNFYLLMALHLPDLNFASNVSNCMPYSSPNVCMNCPARSRTSNALVESVHYPRIVRIKAAATFERNSMLQIY